jgi:hypothetical protein
MVVNDGSLCILAGNKAFLFAQRELGLSILLFQEEYYALQSVSYIGTLTHNHL